MFKFLAFLLILCVLFGVEATREMFFGAVGFIFWAIVILVGAGLLITAFEDHAPVKDEGRKKVEPKPQAKEAKKDAPFWMCALGLAVMLAAIYVYCAWRGWLH